MSCHIPDFIPLSQSGDTNKQQQISNKIVVHINYKLQNKRKIQTKAIASNDKFHDQVDRDFFWAPGEKENYQEDELQRFSRSIIRIVPNFSPRKSLK